MRPFSTDDSRTTIARQLDDARFLNELGIALKARAEPRRALSCFERAHALQPNLAQPRFNAINTNCEINECSAARCQLDAWGGGLSQAERSFLGAQIAYRELRFDDAERAYRATLQAAPDYAPAHVGWSNCLMQRRLFAEAWREYEWHRRLTPTRHRPGPPVLAADAPARQSLEGRGVLVFANQGLGDTIQYSRFLPRLAPHVERLCFECPGPLRRWFEFTPSLLTPKRCELRRPGEPLTDLEVQLPITSLPRIVHELEARPESEATDESWEPPPLPVSFPPQLRRSEQLKRALGLPDSPGLNVGIVWAGNPGHYNDHNRSAPLGEWAPVMRVEGARFFSLQKGPAREQLADSGFPIADMSELPKDFAASAAIVNCLDLVLCVDTSLLHLAGSCVRPVWAALPAPADPRWGQNGETTRWYPSARLFRQTTPGCWRDVFATMAERLAELVRDAHSARRAWSGV